MSDTEFEPDYVTIPPLEQVYGMRLDKNHALDVTTEFVMEQIVNPEEGRYRE